MVRVPSKSKSTPWIVETRRFGVLSFTFGFTFQALFFFALLAEFPDDALFSELAVAARVGAGLTMIKAFLAISDLHLVAFHSGIPIRVITAFHRVRSHSLIFLCKEFVPDVAKG
jgi:hypothetical protein